VHLPPKELAALRLLLAHAGQIVSPQQLRQALWGDVHVTDDSVPKCLSSLRARLEPAECIQTVYKRGYRFTAEVRPLGDHAAGALPRLVITPFFTGYCVPEHLGWAIAEETSGRLTGTSNPIVSILAEDSVFTLARRGLNAHEIGEKLKADLVLTGSLRALPSHYRLRAEMIRVADGVQIWVEDLLVERSRIAGLALELVDRLHFRMKTLILNDRSTSQEWSTEGLSISAAGDSTPEQSSDKREAYEIYQRAHHEWQSLERHRMQDGLQHLLRAAELDPSLMPARVDLVNLCVTQTLFGFMAPSVAADIVRATAQSPADLEPGSEAMMPAVGWVRFHWDRDLSGALLAFSLSSHLPHSPWTTRARVMFALSRHRFGQAIEMLRAAIHQDPFSPWLHARLAWALHLNQQAAASVECIRHALAQFPDHEGANLYGSLILSFHGECRRAVDLARDLAQRLPYFDLATAVHANALACAGQADEALAILQRLQWMSRERFVMSSFTPAVYVALGDHDTAIAELRNSAGARCPWFFQMLADPRLKPLHGRPEFQQMCAILPEMEAEAAGSPDQES